MTRRETDAHGGCKPVRPKIIDIAAAAAGTASKKHEREEAQVRREEGEDVPPAPPECVGVVRERGDISSEGEVNLP